MITIRDYRCDVLVGVALWGDGRWPLDLLAERLRRPGFLLYLGRKSCPLASPLNPGVVMETGPVEALARIEIPEWLRPEWWSEQERGRYLVYSDPVDGFDRPPSTERIPSEPIDRQAWTFGERTVWHLGGHGSEHGDEV